MSEVTRLLAQMDHDPEVAAKLLPLVYEELRRLARAKMAHERSEHTLQATALVHEAYLRLIDGQPAKWNGRRHFFGAAAEAMRRILIEHARRKNSMKQGGRSERVELDEDLPEIQPPCADVADLLALDSAMTRLAAEHPDRAELIKLIYFAPKPPIQVAPPPSTFQTPAVSCAVAPYRFP